MNDVGATVGNRLGRVLLHECDVLVCRRMEHEVGTTARKHLLKARTVTDVGDECANGECREQASQLEHRFEERVLAVTEQHQLAGQRPCNLSAELEPDGAAATRNEHRSPFQIPHVRAQIGWGAPEKVRDVHGAEAIDGYLTVQELKESRNRPCADSRLTPLEDAPHDIAGGLGQRNDHFIRLQGNGDRLEIVQPAHHGDAVYALAMLCRIVVQETHWHEAELRIALHLPHHHGAGIAGAHYQHPPLSCTTFVEHRGSARGGKGFRHDSDGKADAECGETGEQPVDDEHFSREPWHSPECAEGEHDGGDCEACACHATHDQRELTRAGVAPVPPIQPE
jgi:hypothetical protein